MTQSDREASWRAEDESEEQAMEGTQSDVGTSASGEIGAEDRPSTGGSGPSTFDSDVQGSGALGGDDAAGSGERLEGSGEGTDAEGPASGIGGAWAKRPPG